MENLKGHFAIELKKMKNWKIKAPFVLPNKKKFKDKKIQR